MFQFSSLPLYGYGFTAQCMESVHAGCPIRRSPDRRLFAPPRSFSQLVTSFIGSQCQGIRPAPFLLDFNIYTVASVYMPLDLFSYGSMIQFSRCEYIYEREIFPVHIKGSRQPPALPHRLQCSTIGRARLNRRVRDGYGCAPRAHRHRLGSLSLDSSTATQTLGLGFRGARLMEVSPLPHGSLLAKKHILSTLFYP